MSRIRANTITNKDATGAPNFPNGLTGTAATFTGVLTYEDVTNVDSVGVITARSGINISSGQLTVGTASTLNVSGLNVTGIVTATTYHGSGANLTGISVDSTKIETGNTKVETIDTGSDGHVKITTEGSEKARVETDGGVGIGTTTAGTRRLKVLHNADTPLQIHASASNCYMQLGNNSADNIYVGATGNSLTLHNAGERFSISSSGDVTIAGTGNLSLHGAQILEPAFHGYDVQNSSAVNGWKNMQWASRPLDTCSGWDNTNMYWKPNKAGWYLITFAHAHVNNWHDEYESEIKVGGSVIASAACRANRLSVSGLGYMNGTSEYCEWKIYHNNTNHACDNGDKRTSGCAFRLSGVT